MKDYKQFDYMWRGDEVTIYATDDVKADEALGEILTLGLNSDELETIWFWLWTDNETHLIVAAKP